MKSEEEIRRMLIHYDKEWRNSNDLADTLRKSSETFRAETQQRLADYFYQMRSLLIWVLQDDPEGETVSDVGRKSD